MLHLRLASALLATLAIGYWSRFHAPVPEWLRDASGGMFYVLAGAISLRWIGVKHPAAWSFGLTCAVEFLQAWHTPWLMSLRSTVPGRLLLGTHFSWLDFPPYVAGWAVSWLLLRSLLMRCRQ